MPKGLHFTVRKGADRLKGIVDGIRKATGGATAKAGILAGKAEQDHDGLSNLQLAIIHEFGAPDAHIPERSFIRSAFDKGREKYVGMLRDKLLKALYQGKISVKDALMIVAMEMANDMKRGITDGDGIPPPLQPATIQRKGSSRPLLNSGQLKNSIQPGVHMPGDAE